MRKSPMFLTDQEQNDLKEDAVEHLATGHSLKSFVDERGLSYSMVWRLLSDEDNSLLRARNIGTHTLADECIEIADDKTIDPQDKRVRIDTRLRLIGKWNRKDYGDKVDTDITSGGEKIAPIVSDRDRAKAMLDLMRQAQKAAPESRND